VTSGLVAASPRRAAAPVRTDHDAILADGPVFASAGRCTQINLYALS